MKQELTKEQKAIAEAMIDEMPSCIERWGMAFAIGSVDCIGRSMADVAGYLGCSKAAISHRARAFCERNNLKPSHYMKSQ